MKNVLIILISVLLMFSFCVSSFGTDTANEETTQDMSTPRLMVTSYSLDTNELTAGKTSTLKITFHNFSETKSLRNIKLSIIDESGQIEIDGMGTTYINRIYAGKDYVWEVKLTPLQTAEIGRYSLSLASEYEDKYYSSFSASDTVDLILKQTVNIDYSGITIPEKIVEGTTNTMSVTIMNTGKTDIRNCKITLNSETIESAGTTFFGEIKSGESMQMNINYKQKSGKTGDTSATAEISYEDVFGNPYSEKVTLTSFAEKKAEPLRQTDDEDEESKNNLWWLFILTGFAVGIGLGFGITWFINDKKQKKEDDLRL